MGCIFEKIVNADEFRAWTEVSVESVIPFTELYKRYPRRKVSSLFEGAWGEYAELEFRCGCWEYYTFSAQGDCGEWRLVFTNGKGVRHLAAFFEYGWHDGYVQLGNAVTD